MWIYPNATNASFAAVNLNRISTLLDNRISGDLVNWKQVFSNSSRNLPRNPPELVIFDICVFDNSTSTDEWFVKTLQTFSIFLSVSNSVWGKSEVSLVFPILFIDRLKVILTCFFVTDFNISGCDLDNFTLTMFYSVFYIDIWSDSVNIFVEIPLYLVKNPKWFLSFSPEWKTLMRFYDFPDLQ